MHNFDDFENKNYEEARAVDYKILDYVKFFLTYVWIYIQVTAVLLLEIPLSIRDLICGGKPKDISGQIALVTGGGNGLGRAIAFRLGEEKCNVVIVDLNLNEARRTAFDVAQKHKVKTAAYKVDVSDYEAIQLLKTEIERTMGFVDILVNNAGILSTISLREGQPKDLQKLVDVNLTSHVWTVRTFLDTMIERKRGHIVGISSMGGKITIPLAIGYCATKFGVRGFMNALYDELCLYDQDEFINLTTVYPAFINTRKELSDVLDQTKEMTPRMTPEFVADEVVKGLLRNKLDITLPTHMAALQIVNLLPQRVLKFGKKVAIPVVPTLPSRI